MKKQVSGWSGALFTLTVSTLTMASLLANPTSANAQDMGSVGIVIAKVNEKKMTADIAKSDAEIADPKKNIKAATWTKRGDMFVSIDGKALNGLFEGLDETTLKLSIPTASTVEDTTVNDIPYTLYNSGQANIYVSGGLVKFYTPSIVIDSAALDKAYDAYDKAYQLDPKSAKKVKTGMKNIHDKSVENGGANFDFLRNYHEAAVNFRRAFRASSHPAYNEPDTMALFNAGYSGTVAGDYAAALEDLKKALEMGYEKNGDTYYYKAHCQYALEDKEGALQTLQDAVAIYPSNEDIVDLLLKFYADNDGDASALIPVVLGVIEKSPDNPGLYQGLARIYDKLGQNDNAIQTIKKAVAIAPNDFLSNYWEGYFIINKGNALNEELDNKTITSRAQYQEEKAKVDSVFAGAVPPLEKAYGIDQSEPVVVELLKNLTYRLKDNDPAMNEKYEKYLKLYNDENGITE